MKSFVNRKYFQVKAVDGVLFPTQGHASMLGFTPHERRSAYLKHFTLVVGQKNQLIWDLPAIETFLVNKAIYEITPADYEAALKELDELLDLQPLLKKQVRKLSLGERMKCELSAALLHRPKVLFLDEPTIGLDVTMQMAIRQFVAAYNQRHGATIILTSHYMADVTALTKRIIVIDRGQLLYDGDLRRLIEQAASYKLLSLVLREGTSPNALAQYGEIESIEGIKATPRMPRPSHGNRGAFAEQHQGG